MPKVSHRIVPATASEKTLRTTDLLKKLREQSMEDRAHALGDRVGLPYLDLHLFPADPKDVALLPEADAKKYGVALFRKNGNHVYLGLEDPEQLEAMEFLQGLANQKHWNMTISVVSRQSLEKIWASYNNKPLLVSLDILRVSLKGDDLEHFEKNFGDLLNLGKGDASISTSQIIEIILAGATKMRGSDVHIEPGETTARLRYRIDGLLQDIGDLPRHMYQLALARIKMLGGMRINVRDRAQDGHFSMVSGEDRVDIRVSLIPGNHGENIDLRLLNNADVDVDITHLGIYGRAFEEIQRAIEKPNGIILNTGPTGSGKTTTLYSLINRINNPAIKIITVEDPIEYNIAGIVQTEVSKDRDYTFASALRAIVRQDPDVILVGEIRDDETADVAVSASLTGHLVLSTLHTNNAVATIPRLLDLGVKPSLIASSMNIIMAQRLVRILCEECKDPYLPAASTIAAIQKLLAMIPEQAKTKQFPTVDALYRPKGCVHCNFTGYFGRKGIFEVLPVTQAIRDLIDAMATDKELFDAAVKEGMVTMAQDGLIKVLEGHTTMDEVWAASGREDSLRDLYDAFEDTTLDADAAADETADDTEMAEIKTSDSHTESPTPPKV
ncbi:MAG: GspE/PulE family protein [Candidatus Moraniibacteriota bacterium]